MNSRFGRKNYKILTSFSQFPSKILYLISERSQNEVSKMAFLKGFKIQLQTPLQEQPAD